MTAGGGAWRPADPGSAPRCAVHPARLAADACPSCGRPRCSADAGTYAADGCAACRRPAPAFRPVGVAELLVRAGLAGVAVALVGGWVATEYVGVHVMSLVAPGLVGLAASAATSVAARSAEGRGGFAIALTVAAAAALLGTALGFRLTIGGSSPLHPAGQVGPPYLAALGGVLAWPLLFGCPGRPSRVREDQPDAGTVW